LKPRFGLGSLLKAGLFFEVYMREIDQCEEHYSQMAQCVDFVDGVAYWNKDMATIAKKGDRAGYIQNGYPVAYITINGICKALKLHRVHWFKVYGYIPGLLDHIDRNRSNNRIANLREVAWGENIRNRDPRGTSKYIGVYWRKDSRKWRASITYNKKKYNLGCYDTEEDAYKAYVEFCIENNIMVPT
jgi:hypothetical protein